MFFPSIYPFQAADMLIFLLLDKYLHLYSSLSFSTAQAYVFKRNTGECAAFLVNNGTRDVNVLFNNCSHVLPRYSISILPDCKTTVFNTAKVTPTCTLVPHKLNISLPINYYSFISTSPFASENIEMHLATVFYLHATTDFLGVPEVGLYFTCFFYR